MNDKAGPTGKFPDGKIGPDDDGELAVKLSITPEGYLRFDFGLPTAWFAMPPEMAEQFAASIQNAVEFMRQNGKRQ